MQSQQLPTESQVFEDEVRPTTERTDQPAEEMPERHDHGKNFSGKDRIKVCAKSLISLVYDLLARHTVRPAFDLPKGTVQHDLGLHISDLLPTFEAAVRFHREVQ